MNRKFFLSFFKIGVNETNQRIDNFLFKKIKFLPKCKVYSLLRKGNIRVNKKRINYKYKLILNDVIRLPLIDINKKKSIYFIDKYNINILKNSIIYEDINLLIINKPYNIPVHSGKNLYINIIDIFKYLFKKSFQYIELIHRLDRNTSGILMLSKNISSLRLLHYLFKKKKIYKKYIALVHGYWPKSIKKVISLYKYHNFSLKNKKKKYLETSFEIKSYINNFTILYVYPKTGYKHQIRLHTSLQGHPIVFDNIYGNKKLDFNLYNFLGVHRMCLHFYYVSFYYYFKKNLFSIFAKLDQKMDFILKNIKFYILNKEKKIYGSTKK